MGAEKGRENIPPSKQVVAGSSPVPHGEQQPDVLVRRRPSSICRRPCRRIKFVAERLDFPDQIRLRPVQAHYAESFFAAGKYRNGAHVLITYTLNAGHCPNVVWFRWPSNFRAALDQRNTKAPIAIKASFQHLPVAGLEDPQRQRGARE